MPNNLRASVRPAAAGDAADVDPRVARTTHALGRALIALIQEGDFGDITVQHILDRAGVGRTTFYAHYRNKHDVLHSSYERLFGAIEQWVERPSAAGPRLFPVTEFLGHVAEMQRLVDGLRRAGLLDDMWTLCSAYAARLIERRLARSAGVAAEWGAGAARNLVARMLAGALVEAMLWWQDHPSASTPAEMDAAFHAIARRVLCNPHGNA